MLAMNMMTTMEQYPLSERTRHFVGRQRQRMLIDGDWVEALGGETFATLNPADESRLTLVPAATREDVNRAVSAARKAFDTGTWRTLRPAQRQRLMLKLADLMERDAKVLAEIEALDNGKSAQIAQAVDIAMSIDCIRYMAGWSTKIEGSTTDTSVPYAPDAQLVTFIRREAVGVVAAIVPWNFPLMVAVWKLGPALAAGCTVVLKPAEQTPLTALYLGELINEAGFPPGVVNIITGDGPSAGASLTTHPQVDKISFTGSTEVGKLIGKVAMDNMTRVTLELGGKSPVIVLDDADPQAAAAGAAQAIFFNQGQVCCAGSRLYVHKSMYERVVADIAAIAQKLPIGHGFDPNAQLGPLVSQEQFDRVSGYIDVGRQEGAEIVAGGGRHGSKGYFVQPTVMASPQGGQKLRVVREEIFGPVLVAMPYDDLDEVAGWANDTPYGLGASIWSNDLSKVHRLIPKIRAGTVWVNCHSMLDPAMPFGGYKHSGFGRDMGRAALDAYLETKSVYLNV